MHQSNPSIPIATEINSSVVVAPIKAINTYQRSINQSNPIIEIVVAPIKAIKTSSVLHIKAIKILQRNRSRIEISVEINSNSTYQSHQNLSAYHASK